MNSVTFQYFFDLVIPKLVIGKHKARAAPLSEVAERGLYGGAQRRWLFSKEGVTAKATKWTLDSAVERAGESVCEGRLSALSGDLGIRGRYAVNPALPHLQELVHRQQAGPVTGHQPSQLALQPQQLGRI